MNRQALLAGLAVGVVACGGAATPDPAASVVTIASSGCRPTPNVALGVVVGDGLVVTVAHAVAGEEEIAVSFDGRQHAGVVVAVDTVLDAAVVRVDRLGADAVRRRPYEDGETVSMATADDDGEIVARPIDVSGRATIRTSDIYRDGAHERPALDIVADVRGGDSGASILGDDGRLLALVWATSRRTEDRAWALPIEAVDALIEAAASGEPTAPVPCSR
ncbi:MAG: trypsin-like peptidase domain-containing protein [Ilumatobacteraceae bacterium]